jgi:hypothetical protein
MNLNFYDTEEVFKLNPDMKVQVLSISNKYPIVLIDDVYKNPDMVREIALNTPIPLETYFSATRGQLYNFFGNWHTAQTLSNLLIKELQISTCFDENVPDDIVLDNNKLFAFNVMNPKDFPCPPDKYVPPHSDGCMIASVIYLNKDPETPIGTGVYQHIPSGLIIYPQHDIHFEWICQQDNIEPKEYMLKLDEYEKTVTPHTGNAEARGDSTYTVKGNSEWKLLYESPGTYNQLCAYVAGAFHSPLVHNPTFNSKNFCRINQVIFWDWPIPG